MEGPCNILVTGATDGIGLLLAKSYAARGNRVLATGRRALDDHRAYFGVERIVYLQADQQEPVRAAKLIAETAQKLGWENIDVAILNAAIGWAGSPDQEPARSVQNQIAINLTAPVCIAAEIAPWLFAQKGKLVLIGSTAVKGQGSFATYAATKAGLDGLARSLRAEWRGRAAVQIIHPGPTQTDMHKKAGMSVGLARRLFMRPKRVVAAIERAVRSRSKRVVVTRSYAFFASKSKEGRL